MKTTVAASSLMGITQAELDRMTVTATITNGTVASQPTIMPGAFSNSIEPFYTRTLDSPGMKASLQELADLWAARFGNEWVSLQVLREDEFWHIAVERLHKKDFLEEMRVSSQEHLDQITVYRLCK